MGAATKYWILLACLLATIYGSFVLWRRDQAAPSAAAIDAAPSSAVSTSSQTTAEHEPAPTAEVHDPEPFADFVLTDQQGQPFDSRSLHGKVWVGSFFFTNCPAVCWRLNQALAALQETDPDGKARFVSITCDPENDTPPVLAKYAEHFKADPARWTFLTGDMDRIRSIGNDTFKVAVETSTHSDRAFVVDRQGKVRGRFRLTEPDQLEMLKKQLALVEAEQVEANEPTADAPKEASDAQQADVAQQEAVPASSAAESTSAGP